MFERCIYFNTNALARKLNAKWEKAFAKFDLSPSHGYLLRLVLEQPGLPQRAIAMELRLEKSTVTRFLSQLELKGLIKRANARDNNRENAITPTKKALNMQADLNALGDDLYASMCKTIGEKNVKEFVASIRETADIL